MANQLEDSIRQQKEYLEFLGRQITAETQILIKIKKSQEEFIKTLKEKEKELQNKEKQVNEYFAGVEAAKKDLRERQIRCNEREEKLIELHNELLENKDLSNWLQSKKLIFLNRSREELNSLKEDFND